VKINPVLAEPRTASQSSVGLYVFAGAGSHHCHDNTKVTCYPSSTIQNKCFSVLPYLHDLVGFVGVCLLKPTQSVPSNEMLLRSALNPLIKAFAWIMEDGFTPLSYKIFYEELE